MRLLYRTPSEYVCVHTHTHTHTHTYFPMNHITLKIFYFEVIDSSQTRNLVPQGEPMCLSLSFPVTSYIVIAQNQWEELTGTVGVCTPVSFYHMRSFV